MPSVLPDQEAWPKNVGSYAAHYRAIIVAAHEQESQLAALPRTKTEPLTRPLWAFLPDPQQTGCTCSEAYTNAENSSSSMQPNA